MSKTDTLATFLFGAAIGAVAALLLAPAKGSETRSKIADMLRDKGIDLSKEDLDKFVELLESRLGKSLSKNDEEDPNTAS